MWTNYGITPNSKLEDRVEGNASSKLKGAQLKMGGWTKFGTCWIKHEQNPEADTVLNFEYAGLYYPYP